MSESAKVAAAWQRTVDAEPSATILVASRRWTRRELDEGAGTRARSLPAGTALRGRKVALADAEAERWLISFLALCKCGAVPVLLEAGDGADSLVESARRLGATALWSADSWLPLKGSSVSRAAVIKVTSGSTGWPKPIACDAATFFADGDQVAAAMGLSSSDVNFAVVPLGHAYGLGNLVLPLIQRGCRLALCSYPIPHTIGTEVAESEATVVPLVPRIVRALTESTVEAALFASVRLFVSAGAPLSSEQATAFRARFGKPVHSLYGSTETGSIAFDTEGGAAEFGEGVVGRILPQVSARVTRSGRLHVSSPAVANARGWLMPDKVEFLPDGRLRLRGRFGRQHKIGGRRVDLSGLESALARVEGVREVVVQPHPKKADKLAALVATDLDREVLRQRFRLAVASWKVPDRIVPVAEIPRNARGKIDRNAVVHHLAAEG